MDSWRSILVIAPKPLFYVTICPWIFVHHSQFLNELAISSQQVKPTFASWLCYASLRQPFVFLMSTQLIPSSSYGFLIFSLQVCYMSCASSLLLRISIFIGSCSYRPEVLHDQYLQCVFVSCGNVNGALILVKIFNASRLTQRSATLRSDSESRDFGHSSMLRSEEFLYKLMYRSSPTK